MIRSTARRAAALLGAVFFLLSSVGESFGFNPCPYHDALGDAALAAHHSAAHHGADLLSDHDHTSHHGDEAGEAHEAAGVPSDARDNHKHDICTHVEVCQTSAGAIAPLDVEPGTFQLFAATRIPVLPPVEPIIEAILPFVLPYSNAPPVIG